MPENAYDRLSFLDNSFLVMETLTSPMQVAGIATFEAGPLQRAEGGIDIDKIRDYVSSRLRLIPRYRQRLAHIPIEDHAVWVDDTVCESARGLTPNRLPILTPLQIG